MISEAIFTITTKEISFPSIYRGQTSKNGVRFYHHSKVLVWMFSERNKQEMSPSPENKTFHTQISFSFFSLYKSIHSSTLLINVYILVSFSYNKLPKIYQTIYRLWENFFNIWIIFSYSHICHIYSHIFSFVL